MLVSGAGAPGKRRDGLLAFPLSGVYCHNITPNNFFFRAFLTVGAATAGGAMSVMTSDLEGYFRGFVPSGDDLLGELEREAEQERIPIVGPVVGELLFILARATGAGRILELGTATGYSAIYLGRGSEAAGGRVLTLEQDENLAARARAHLARAGLGERVEVRVGEALTLVAALAGPLDLIFL